MKLTIVHAYFSLGCLIVASGCSSPNSGQPGSAADAGADVANDTSVTETEHGETSGTETSVADTKPIDELKDASNEETKKETSIDGSTDGSTDGSITKGETTIETGTGTCNTLVNSGTAISGTFVDATAPAPLGGTIANGTYRLTDIAIYTGPGGATGVSPSSLQVTAKIEGTTMNSVSSDSSGAKEERETLSLKTSGTSVTLTPICSSDMAVADTADYTAKDKVLILYIKDKMLTAALTLTKE
ncbi:MAG: hypothetical protein NVSMB1_16000 [Polyangiales bacterium]